VKKLYLVSPQSVHFCNVETITDTFKKMLLHTAVLRLMCHCLYISQNIF